MYPTLFDVSLPISNKPSNSKTHSCSVQSGSLESQDVIKNISEKVPCLFLNHRCQCALVFVLLKCKHKVIHEFPRTHTVDHRKHSSNKKSET